MVPSHDCGDFGDLGWECKASLVSRDPSLAAPIRRILMSRCLTEYVLLMLYTGEGTERDFAHLSVCQGCSRRYQDLARDWRRMKQIFHYASLPRPTMVRLGLVTPWRWLSGVAALATA